MVVARQNLGAFRPVSGGIGKAAAIVADAVDLHVATEVIILQQRAARFDVEVGPGLAQLGVADHARPDAGIPFAEIGTGTLTNVSRCHISTCAGAQVASAVRHKVADALQAFLAQRLAVRGGLAAVHIDHAVARRAVRVEQAAVLIHRAAHHQGGLQHGVGHREILGAGRGKILQRIAHIEGRGQVGPRVEHDAAVHEDIFVVTLIVVEFDRFGRFGCLRFFPRGGGGGNQNHGRKNHCQGKNSESFHSDCVFDDPKIGKNRRLSPVGPRPSLRAFLPCNASCCISVKNAKSYPSQKGVGL